jgi:hypothetical protein
MMLMALLQACANEKQETASQRERERRELSAETTHSRESQALSALEAPKALL